MKHLLRTISLFSFMFCLANSSPAQILKKLERKVNQKVNSRVDRKIDKTIDKGLDEIEGKEANNTTTTTTDQAGAGDGAIEANEFPANTGFSYTSKFDFVPGNKILVYEDFSSDAIGDLPAAWNTNGSAEVVRLNNEDARWMLMKTGALFIPDLPATLPDDYTLEFDVYASGIDKNTSSTAVLSVFLTETKSLQNYEKNFANFTLPFCQYTPVGMQVRNGVYDDKSAVITNTVKTDLRKVSLQKFHVAVSANEKRLRFGLMKTKRLMCRD